MKTKERIGLWIADYRCGCSAGPRLRRELLEYCGKHGDDVKHFYPMSTEAAMEEQLKPKRKAGGK